MKRLAWLYGRSHSTSSARIASAMVGIVLGMAAPWRALAEPTAAAVAGYDASVRGLEARLALQHQSDLGFLAGVDAVGGLMRERLRGGELIVEPLTQGGSALPGAMLNHWRATAFIPGARGADFGRLMGDFGGYAKVFAPQVLEARGLGEKDGRAAITMRVRQQHVITVVMDTVYEVSFGQLDAGHGYSMSRSTQIREIAAAGTRSERVLRPDEEHGFLWRQNTYWSYAERDGGLYVQVEAVSLSRAIPHGLGWAVGPFVETVPRESLEFTLRSVVKALKK